MLEEGIVSNVIRFVKCRGENLLLAVTQPSPSTSKQRIN